MQLRAGSTDSCAFMPTSASERGGVGLFMRWKAGSLMPRAPLPRTQRDDSQRSFAAANMRTARTLLDSLPQRLPLR